LRNIILSILACFLILACQTGKKPIQVQIDNKQQFAYRLADLYFMDSWVNRSKKDDKDSIKMMLYSDFEKLHGISVDDFHSELAVLKTDPIIFAEIMDSVGVILKNKGELKK